MEAVNSNSIPGLSLMHAYQPFSDEEMLECYSNHPCAACGASVAAASLPEVPELEVGRILFKIFPKLCGCGYTNEVFTILNNLLQQLDSTIPGVSQAIADAQNKNLLLDPFLEEQLVASKVAIHQGKLEAAATINRHLTVRFPNVFLPFYNLGVIYSQQQRYVESLEAYEAALQRHPGHSESVANKAGMLMQLSRLREAGETYEQWRVANPEGTVILAAEEGMFGQVQVVDEPEVRSLCIDDQVQGSFYKQPTANEYEPNCRSGPGPLSEDSFVAGFLLVGCQMPRALGLVFGLGCGAGLVTNLACFPQMRLTVVEIDPVVIRLCLTFFPMVQHYVEAGRLEIVKADAEAFLYSNRTQFDFIQCDTYQGIPELPSKFVSIEFIQLMRATAPLLFVNVIGQLDRPHLHRVLAAFDAANTPIRAIYPSVAIASNETTPMNWFCLNQEVNIPTDFLPFSNWEGDRLQTVRDNFSALLKNTVSPDRLRSYMENFGLVITPHTSQYN